MNPNPSPLSESRDEISMLRTQPLPIIRLGKNHQPNLTYLLFALLMSIVALVLGVFFVGFPFMIFGGAIKWIKYLRKRKTAEEIRPWFRLPALISILTYAMGWAALGERLSFQAIGSILSKSNLFFLFCFLCLYVYFSVIICLEVQAEEKPGNMEKRKPEEERIKALRPKVFGWGLGLGIVLFFGGVLLTPGNFPPSFTTLFTVGGAITLLGGFMIWIALFFAEDFIGLCLRI